MSARAVVVATAIGMAVAGAVASATTAAAPAAATTAAAASDVAGRSSLPLQAGRRITFETSEGTWLSPAQSRDGRIIAFEMLGDLYTVPATGGRAERLTSGLAFDSQPAFAPDGRLVFVSDRSGAENLWVVDAQGRAPEPLTSFGGDSVLASPSWSADGQRVFFCRFRAGLNAFELLQVGAGEAGASVRTGVPVANVPGEPEVLVAALDASGRVTSRLGPKASRDGLHVYYATRTDGAGTAEVPEWHVRRLELASGREETLIAPARSYRPDLILGTAFRPAISPDGRTLAYATRNGAETWLRLRDLVDGRDEWLTRLSDRDALAASSPWRDLLQNYDFTPDGRAIIAGDAGGIRRIELGAWRDRAGGPLASTAEPHTMASAAAGATPTRIEFRAKVDVVLGPATRVRIAEPDGPVRARVIQDPQASPDGRRLVFSALGALYLMPLEAGANPRRLAAVDAGYQPGWSPDGRSIAYVTWQAGRGGHVMLAPAGGTTNGGVPRQVSTFAAHYTDPVFSPDGRAIAVLRSPAVVRDQRYMEYGPLREAELAWLPLDGRPTRVLAQGAMGGKPHFSGDGREVHVLTPEGLVAIRVDDGARRAIRRVTGPGFYFDRERALIDDARLSPDGRWLLVQIAQQLHLLDLGTGHGAGADIDVSWPTVPHRKLTDVGADFFDWADGGRTITWAVGSTFYRRALADVALDPPVAARSTPPGTAGAQSFRAEVTVPRDRPRGALLLRGATAITLRDDEVIPDADLLIVDGRIAGIGPRGSVDVPRDAAVRELDGRWIVPGLIDAHDHRADIRRGVLDPTMWSAAASLAYGVTTLFDPSTLSIDMLVYEDMIDAGLITGSRLRSTGPALFSFNDFRTREEVGKVLDRYRDHYGLRNLKMYRTGNRRVRQWIVSAARERGMMATTEGAGSAKLGLTMILDGYAGHEHALPLIPLYADVVRLLAASRTSYTGTLTIQGLPTAQDWFIAREAAADDPKLARFTPRWILAMKTRFRHWFVTDAYRFPDHARGLAAVARAGGVVAIGSHGEMPGIGYHWELHAHAAGGFTPRELLRAATMGSATAIGRDRDLGSLETGKLADLLVLTADPLLDVRNLAALEQVMKEGRLYDAATLDELYPRRRPFPKPWHADVMPPSGAP